MHDLPGSRRFRPGRTRVTRKMRPRSIAGDSVRFPDDFDRASRPLPIETVKADFSQPVKAFHTLFQPPLFNVAGLESRGYTLQVIDPSWLRFLSKLALQMLREGLQELFLECAVRFQSTPFFLPLLYITQCVFTPFFPLHGKQLAPMHVTFSTVRRCRCRRRCRRCTPQSSAPYRQRL